MIDMTKETWFAKLTTAIAMFMPFWFVLDKTTMLSLLILFGTCIAFTAGAAVKINNTGEGETDKATISTLTSMASMVYFLIIISVMKYMPDSQGIGVIITLLLMAIAYFIGLFFKNLLVINGDDKY